MKKIIALLLTLTTVVTLASCAGGNGDQTDESTKGGPKKTDSADVGGQTPGKTDPAGTNPQTSGKNDPAVVPHEIPDSKGLAYELNETKDGYIVVGIGECKDTEIGIPEKYEGLPVVQVGEQAFEDCTGIIYIEIPNSVTFIGECAFENCTNLTSITIPDGVTEIGDSVFSDCTSLTNITIPNSVTAIRFAAFENCTGLTSITFPNSMKMIGNSAFKGCTGLTSITIPDSVTSIDSSAFRSTGLTSITVSEGNSVYHSAGNCLIKTESKAIIAGFKTSVIPDDGSVTLIDSGAFEDCTGLTSITIPNSVTKIGYGAFKGCTGLTNIVIPNSVTAIDLAVFSDCTGLTSITIPNSVTKIEKSTFEGCTSLTSITIPNSVTYIGPAFRDCTGLTSITVSEGNPVYHSAGNCVINTESKTLVVGCKTSVIPNDGSVTSIDSFAFDGCTGMTSIIIPNCVTKISSRSFYSCSGLTSITVSEGNPVYHSTGNCLIETESKTLVAGCKTSVIPDDGSVTSIGENAFYRCMSLTSITIPNSVTEIGEYAFSECYSLTDIYYAGTEAQWAELAEEAEVPETATVHYNSKG